MKLPLLLLTLLSFTSQATPSEEVFQIAGKSYSFIFKKDVWVSGCQKNCVALKKLDQLVPFTQKDLFEGDHFSSAIGSKACSKIMKASAVIGLAKNRDQRAFCYFKEDESMIEINSLSDYLTKKKLVTE